MACWVSQAEAFPLNGNDDEECLFTTVDMGEALIAVLEREGIDDKGGLEERGGIVDDPILTEARELLVDFPAFVGAIAFIVR
jgi:hypothetical protein